jgi:transcriptional antiterminator RfaH
MSWCVLHVRPRCEKKLSEFCRVMGISHYLPLREETKVYQRRKVTVLKPVFPGYLFASFDRSDRLAILKTNNIVRIMECDDQRQLLHQLAQVRKALSTDVTLSSCSALTSGKLVRIRSGSFMGLEGRVLNIRARTKVRLNVELIGQAVMVEVDRALVEVLD